MRDFQIAAARRGGPGLRDFDLNHFSKVSAETRENLVAVDAEQPSPSPCDWPIAVGEVDERRQPGSPSGADLVRALSSMSRSSTPLCSPPPRALA